MHRRLVDNLEGLTFGSPAVSYYVDSNLKVPYDGQGHTGNLYYYHPSPLEQEIRRIFDRATSQLAKQTA
jgi:hypothetical protein